MVIDAIIKGARAWTSARELTKRYGMAALEECARAGLIECWDHDRAGRRLRAPAWTLTTRCAYMYRLRIVEIPDSKGLGVPFWSDGHEDEDGHPRRLVRLAIPRPIEPAPRPAVKGSVVTDADGQPLVVLGAVARADPRLHAKGRKHPGIHGKSRR